MKEVNLVMSVKVKIKHLKPGIAYEDDDQVAELLVRKHRVKAAAEERVEIEIREAV